MASPILSVDRLRELLEYNPETGVFVYLVTRGKAMRGQPVTRKHPDGYISVCLDGRNYMGHRLAVLYVTGQWPADQVDHINGVKDDNRWANLRGANTSENAQNQRKAKSSNKSGFLGVSPSSSKSNPWQSAIRVNGTYCFLGVFPTAERAHEAYLLAKRDKHPFGTVPTP